MRYRVETEREPDGRWLADVVELPGVMAYGPTREAAVHAVEALALRVLAERLEHGELHLNCGDLEGRGYLRHEFGACLQQ